MVPTWDEASDRTSIDSSGTETTTPSEWPERRPNAVELNDFDDMLNDSMDGVFDILSQAIYESGVGSCQRSG